jgi:hypothetical protein
MLLMSGSLIRLAYFRGINNNDARGQNYEFFKIINSFMHTLLFLHIDSGNILCENTLPHWYSASDSRIGKVFLNMTWWVCPHILK